MFEWPALITIFTLILMFVLMYNVGRARERHQVSAPSVTGNPSFERCYRVQLNTLESVIIFLPALWLFSIYVNAIIASILGLIWLLSRIWYASVYTGANKNRRLPFGISALIAVILTLGSLISVIQLLMQSYPI